MNLKKIIFITSFILLSILFGFADISKKINYYNIDSIDIDSLTVHIKFENKPYLDNKKIDLYYIDSVYSSTSFSNDKKITASVNNHTIDFKFISKKIPILFRINFDKGFKDTVIIKQFSINLNKKKIDINLSNFISHPSVQILKKESDFIKINLSPKKNIRYDPYIYLEKPLSVHKISATEIILIIFIILILSFLLSEALVYLLNFKASIGSINSILIFLLILSLLFKEHWISKITIIISFFTVYLVYIKKIQLKKIHFYGFLIFFIYAAFSLIWSVNFHNTLLKIISYLPFVIIPVWVSSLSVKLKYNNIFNYVGITFMLVSFVTILSALFRFSSSHNSSEFYYHTLASPLSTNAIYISILYLNIFLFNLFFLLINNKTIKPINYLSLIIMFIYIILLNSKLIILLLLITTVFIIYRSLKIRFIKFKTITLLISVFLLLIFIFHENLSRRYNEILNLEKLEDVYSLNEFGETYLWNGLNLRFLQLRAFYDIEKDDNPNILLGVGLNNGQIYLNKKYKDYKMYTGKPWEKDGGFLTYNFHNQYIQTIIELGFVGFLLLIYILYNLIYKAKSDKNFLLFSVVFILILIMFTESILARQKGIMFFVLFPLIAMKVMKTVKNISFGFEKHLT